MRPIALLRSMGAALGAIVHDVIVAVAIVAHVNVQTADEPMPQVSSRSVAPSPHQRCVPHATRAS